MDDYLIETMEDELEENGYSFTYDPFKAIYIFPDGRCLDADYSSGCRANDHRCIDFVTANDRYDPNFWEEVFDLGLIIVEPDTMSILYPSWLTPTMFQQPVIDHLIDGGYKYYECDENAKKCA